MRSRLTFIIVLLTALFISVNLNAQLRLVSGLEGEIYNQFAIDIKNNTDVPIVIFTSAGSKENINKLLNDSIQLGFLQYDVLLYNEMQNPTIKDYLKVMLPLYDEEVHLISRNGDDIKSLEDLQGKRVGIGSEKSGTSITATFIQYKTGLKWNSINLPFEQSFTALINDSIDAFFYVGAAPSNLLKSLSTNLQQLIKLVPITSESLKDFYLTKTIEKGVYDWSKQDVQTISVRSLIAINTKNVDDSTDLVVESLYNDLKGNLTGIQKNKLSHPKWDDVDFTNMDGVDWPVYRKKFISLDFVSLIVAYLAALLSLIQIYFIINKLWKRKHEKVVAESISISAMFISILINMSFAFKNLHDGGLPQFSANILWIGSSLVSTLIGMGIWVQANRGVGYIRLLFRALNLERKEAGDLAKVFFKPAGAEKILEILGRMAMVDEDLDDREKEYIEHFAQEWGISVDWDQIQKYVHESGDRFEKIKQALADYLKTSPPEDQVTQLRDVFNILVNIDEIVTEEEQLIIDELEGQIAVYLKNENELQVFQVALVPQNSEQDQAISARIPNLIRERIAGGYAYLSAPYFSERYAEMISAQYRSM
ncbi:MAG: TAXI family TRAP transporter solute-binding subunit, partial [Bacteroidales bacterium]|nr:TAXI family TRAP transporter solute-binding subunit [Bacteroidales bacterium]